MTKVKSFPYEASLKAKWDTQNAFDYAIKEAAKEAAKAATEKERAKADQEKLDSAKFIIREIRSSNCRFSSPI
ncbi:MAG: hypothetical protein QHC79_17615 [Pseudosphingobacterium sp.]|nr:hypothetical protein [Pseudosphingobacterium sp.]